MDFNNSNLFHLNSTKFDIQETLTPIKKIRILQRITDPNLLNRSGVHCYGPASSASRFISPIKLPQVNSFRSEQKTTSKNVSRKKMKTFVVHFKHSSPRSDRFSEKSTDKKTSALREIVKLRKYKNKLFKKVM